MRQDWKREYFSVPNLMGYFRIILIPVYLWLYFNASGTADYVKAAAVIGISELTDCFDGKIARRFDLITEWGKILDPIADKLTLGAVILSLTFRYPLMRAVVLLYIVKEGYMLIMGGLMMKKGRQMDGAQWYGKVCTAYTYVMIFLLLLIPGLPAMATKAMIGLCCLIMLFTLASYVLFYGRMRKEAGEEESH